MMHDPPAHDRSHVLPAAHVIVHAPPAHVSLHVVFAGHVKLHDPTAQLLSMPPASFCTLPVDQS